MSCSLYCCNVVRCQSHSPEIGLGCVKDYVTIAGRGGQQPPRHVGLVQVGEGVGSLQSRASVLLLGLRLGGASLLHRGVGGALGLPLGLTLILC